jgi:hypothetical protein
LQNAATLLFYLTLVLKFIISATCYSFLSRESNSWHFHFPECFSFFYTHSHIIEGTQSCRGILLKKQNLASPLSYEFQQSCRNYTTFAITLT